MEDIHWSFVLIVESDLSMGGKKELIFCWYLVYTNTFISTAQYIKAPAGKIVEFVTTKSTSVPTNKNLADDIVPHIYSALRDLVFILEEYILSSGPILADIDPSCNLVSLPRTQNEQNNSQNNMIEG